MHKEQRGEKVWRCFWEKCVKEAAIGKAAPNVIRRGVEFPGSPPCPWWHRIAVGVGWTGNIVLTIAVIALGVWEGSKCKLCPRDWLLHGDKCYWLSKESKDWAGSRDDCLWKSSHMLVIQNWEEMASIQNVTQGVNCAWIGLKVTPPGGKWTWVDDSPLDPMP
ncbi:Killer cell lectin-like receptor subfamily F member 1 [Chelonia mydas]|uniref:Killer cell lectin-like receptor subfamily F member 1 n=1 Tax=Chelonia mydas TaxID=8469 RepID=M7BXI0_CHEMY|nr:Killer cell lectin-like receptor subfamily F member 1 [Chelonia mydas]